MSKILRGLGILSAIAFLLPEFRTPYGFAMSLIGAILWFAFASALEHLQAIRIAVESIEVRILRSAAQINEEALPPKATTLMSEAEIATAEQAMKVALRKD